MKTIQVTLPEDLHSRLKDACHDARKNIGDFVRGVLDKHLPQSALDQPVPPTNDAPTIRTTLGKSR